jgi:hypothetical protein
VAFLSQRSFRFRRDDGTEATATWIAAENVPIALREDEQFRIRFELQNVTAGALGGGAQLQYRKNNSTWNNVTGASLSVRVAASPNVADNAATTDQMSAGSGAFVAGNFDEVDGIVGAAVSIAANGHTEHEFSIVLRSADLVVGDRIELRLSTAGGGVIDIWVATPLIVVEGAVTTTPADWSFVLCNRLGVPIEEISHAITSYKFAYRINRPVSLRLTVPSDHAKIGTLHTDGRPMLTEMRTIKCYRRGVLRANLYVWTLNDQGDGDHVQTEALCFGPEMRLARRLTRDAMLMHKRSVAFTNLNLGTVIGQLIERTNSALFDTDADTFVDDQDPCGVLSDASSFVDGLIPSQSIIFEYKTIGEVLTELTANVPFEYEIEPLDRTDGYLGRMHYRDRTGVSRPSLRFSYQAVEANCSAMERNSDVTSLANVYHAHGGRAVRKEAMMTAAEMGEAVTDYGVFEDHGVFESISIQAYLDLLAEVVVNLRMRPREIVKWTPMPDAVEPFLSFNVGDSISVLAGARLRGGFEGVQRIYGFDLEGNPQGGEQLTAILTSPEA